MNWAVFFATVIGIGSLVSAALLLNWLWEWLAERTDNPELWVMIVFILGAATVLGLTVPR
jgi:hypothetical protein